MSSERGRYLFVYEEWVEGVNEREALEVFLREMKNDQRKFVDCLEFQSEDDDFY